MASKTGYGSGNQPHAGQGGQSGRGGSIMNGTKPSGGRVMNGAKPNPKSGQVGDFGAPGGPRGGLTGGSNDTDD